MRGQRSPIRATESAHDHSSSPPDASAPTGTEPEQCICAAIQLPNGEVWRGHRHDNALQVAGKAPGVSRDDLANAVQGFITSRNRFVTREEGADIQRRAGIVSATTGAFTDFLFSEDLYLRNWRSSPPDGSSPGGSREKKDDVIRDGTGVEGSSGVATASTNEKD